MLVLSRQENEQIYIYCNGDSRPLGVITVCSIRSGQVRLGFEGDEDIVFHRREVAEAISRNGEDPSMPLSKGPRKT